MKRKDSKEHSDKIAGLERDVERGLTLLIAGLPLDSDKNKVRQLRERWTAEDRSRPEFGELAEEILDLKLGSKADSLLELLRAAQAKAKETRFPDPKPGE